ncbi:MAG: hypothetical protein GX854_13600 [Clostridiales bacterium]|jgi:hypothetical protein|nr:hypothetical protein [Clostridiales bacterium]
MKVFIAGPRSVTKLNPIVIKKLDNIMMKKYKILVGDANGADKAVQKYCSEQGYNNVVVYSTGERTRNNIGNWEKINVSAPKGLKGFDFYAVKDKQMAKDADYGFMIWNGRSKGTFNNLINLVKFNKTALLFLTTNNKYYKIKDMDDINKLTKLVNNYEIDQFLINRINSDEQLILEL